MRHLRTRKANAVCLVLLENVRHPLVDICLLVESEEHSPRLIARIDEIRRALTHLGIRLAFLLEFFETRELLRTIRLVLERCFLNRLFILAVGLVQLRRELGEQSRCTLTLLLVRRCDAHEFELTPLCRERLYLSADIQDMSPAEHTDRVVVEHTARMIRVEAIGAKHDDQKANAQYNFLCNRHFLSPSIFFRFLKKHTFPLTYFDYSTPLREKPYSGRFFSMIY